MVTWPDESFETVEGVVQNRLPGCIFRGFWTLNPERLNGIPVQEIPEYAPGRVLTRYPLKVKAYKDALHQYLECGRVDIHELSLDLQGTDFQNAVWQTLIDIPAGQTRTYSDIAQRIGRQDAVRAVAHAIGVNPIPFLIPCHRVIGKDGNLRGYRGGLLLKERLLQLEGFLPKEP